MAKYVLSAFADEAGKSLDEQIAALVRNDIGCIEVRMIDGKGIADSFTLHHRHREDSPRPFSFSS